MLNLFGSNQCTFYPLLADGDYARLMLLVKAAASIHINTHGCKKPMSQDAARAIDEAARRIARHYAKGGTH